VCKGVGAGQDLHLGEYIEIIVVGKVFLGGFIGLLVDLIPECCIVILAFWQCAMERLIGIFSGKGLIPEKFIPLFTFCGSVVCVVVVVVVVVAFRGVFPGLLL
jgi:hypothetical protein